MAELPVTPELWSLTSMALDYGAHAAADVRETFQPALVTETADGEKQITRLALGGFPELIVSNEMDEATRRELIGTMHELVLPSEEVAKEPLGAALSRLAEQDEVVRAAVVVDGITHIEGVREDAIIVLVAERGQAHSHEFAQRYRRSGLRKKFQAVGNVGYVGERPPIFP